MLHDEGVAHLARELAIKKIKAGKASSQLLMYFLQSESENEKDRMNREINTLQAEILKLKIKNMESDDGNNNDVINAIKRYRGK